MTAPAVPRGTSKPTKPAPRPVASLDDVLLELIDIDDNVRDDPGDLDELAANIAENGQLQPVKVTTQPDGRYRLVYGQRRVLACRQLGRLKISAIVEPASDVDQAGARRSIAQLSENLVRKDLNPIEEAVALREVLDADPNLTQEALADKLGMSRPWVSNTLRLLKADEVVQEGVRRGVISASHAKALIVLPAGEQRSLAKRIEDGMSAHTLEQTISWKVDELKRREAQAKRTEKAIPRALAALEEAGVGKDVQVYVRAHSIDVDPIAKAIGKAGWTYINTYVMERGSSAKCDCKVVTLEFSRKWAVTPGCIDDRHRDRQRNVDHGADEKRRKETRARVDELRIHVRDALEGVPLPVLLLAHGDLWALPTLVANAATSDRSELLDLVADAMANRADASKIWNDRRESMEVALKALLAMFAPVEAPAATPEPAPPKPAKGKKAAAT